MREEKKMGALLDYYTTDREEQREELACGVDIKIREEKRNITKLETGLTPTAFVFAGNTIQGELAACQRYYWRSSATNNANTFYGFGVSNSTTNAQIIIYNPVPMRVNPTSLEFSTVRCLDYASSFTVSSVTMDQAGQLVSNINCAITGATTNTPMRMLANANTSSYFGLSAEL